MATERSDETEFVPSPASSAKERGTKYSEKLLKLVADPGCALRYTVVALVVAVVLYIVIHIVLPAFHLMDPGKIGNLSHAVEISDDGRFRCYYRDDILDRFIARDKVNEWKQRMDEKALAFSADALIGRRAVLLPLEQFVRNSLSDQAALVKPWTQGVDSTNQLLSVSLLSLTNWLESQRLAVQPAKRTLVDEFVQRIGVQKEHETMLRERLLAEIAGLKSNLSFDWFFIDGWMWTIEVFFWCTFGVLANTLITLIYATREDRYDPREFLLVVPKGALAPVLAVVIIAWWTTGLSESKINYLNLPYFLVLSFALGFVTESLYVKIKELGNLIVGPSAAASAARMEAAAKREAYQFVHPSTPLAAMPPAADLETLRDQLRTAVKAGMERGIVAQLSATGKTKS